MFLPNADIDLTVHTGTDEPPQVMPKQHRYQRPSQTPENFLPVSRVPAFSNLHSFGLLSQLQSRVLLWVIHYTTQTLFFGSESDSVQPDTDLERKFGR